MEKRTGGFSQLVAALGRGNPPFPVPFLLQIMAVRSMQNSKMLARLMPRAGTQQKNVSIPIQQQQHNDQDQEQKSKGAWGAIGVGLLGAGLAFTAPLLADDGKKKVFGKTQADRVRQYATADNVFDHFATYQLVNDVGEPFRFHLEIIYDTVMPFAQGGRQL